jgi:prophage regulatory protein
MISYLNGIFFRKGITMKRIIRFEELQNKLGGKGSVSNVTIWRWERDGIFPKRVKVGPACVGWLESEVDGWIERQAAERVVTR